MKPLTSITITTDTQPSFFRFSSYVQYWWKKMTDESSTNRLNNRLHFTNSAHMQFRSQTSFEIHMQFRFLDWIYFKVKCYTRCSHIWNLNTDSLSVFQYIHETWSLRLWAAYESRGLTLEFIWIIWAAKETNRPPSVSSSFWRSSFGLHFSIEDYASQLL